MGGIGSGRRSHSGVNETTDDYRSIDVRRWRRDGLLIRGRHFSWQWSSDDEGVASINVRVESDRVILIYRHRSYGNEWEDENYPVRLAWTSCHLGGQRPWFLCPAQGCGRRVAILYGGAIFACQYCFQLAYQSQRDAKYDRSGRKADRIRARLDWEPGFLNGPGQKPKGMHWRTFYRLKAEHDAYVENFLDGINQRFGIDL